MLTRKIGPLPLWAWIGIAAAGVVAGIYLRRRLSQSAGSTSSNVPATTGDTGNVGSNYPNLGGAVSGGGTSSGIAPAPSGIDPAQYVQDVLSSFQAGGANALSTYQAGEAGSLTLLQTAEAFFRSPGGGDGTNANPPPVNVTIIERVPNSTKKAVTKAKATTHNKAIPAPHKTASAPYRRPRGGT